MHISQLRDQRAHRITNTLQLTYIPQLLAANIQYKCKNYKMHIPRTRARRAQIHPPTDIYHPIDGCIYPKPIYILQNVYSPFATDISSNCWQYIRYKCKYYIMYIAQPWAQRAHWHFETDIYLPIVQPAIFDFYIRGPRQFYPVWVNFWPKSQNRSSWKFLQLGCKKSNISSLIMALENNFGAI